MGEFANWFRLRTGKTVSMPRHTKYFSTGYCVPIRLPSKDNAFSYGEWSAPWGDSGTVVAARGLYVHRVAGVLGGCGGRMGDGLSTAGTVGICAIIRSA
jgi:hypothetical protein